MQADCVVEQAGDEDDRATGDDARRSLRTAADARQDGRGDAGGEAGEDADPAEVRRGARVPAVRTRRRHEARAAGDRITSQSTTTVTGYEMRNAVALTVRRLNVGY